MKTIEGKILEMYKKDTFTTADSEFIGNAIENFDIYTDDIKLNCMDYIYGQLEKDFEKDTFHNEDIWNFTDEHLSNGCTHKENYDELIEHLKLTNSYFSDRTWNKGV
jgi:hypothetical protein